MEGLHFELPVGLQLNGEVHKEVELLTTNGVAEKVFLKKSSEKPFTWQGNVVSIAVKRIGGIEIASECRKKYLEDNSVTIPPSVLALSLADINTLMVEIHRRVWESVLPKQEIICKYCYKRLIQNTNLNKTVMLPETVEKISDIKFDYAKLSATLKDGFMPPPIPRLTDKEEYAGITDIVFNTFTFRPPLLSDAIRNEAYASDSIGFWRRIAMDCLIGVERVEGEEVLDSLPREFFTYYGLRIFNEYLSAKDLKSVRAILTEYLPTLPFAYYDVCGCEEQREIPMMMEASSFFSE